MSKSSQSKRPTTSGPRTTGTTSRPITASAGSSKTTSRPISTASTASKTTSRPVSSAASATASRPVRDTTAPRALRDTTAPRALRDTTAPRPGSSMKRKQTKEDWWTRYRWVAITVGSLAVVIALFFWLSSGKGGNSGQTVPASIMNAVSNVPPNNFNTVGTGGLANPMHATPANTQVPHGSGGLPVVFYNGGEFCPYCAAERWSMVVALSRFGTFKNLHLTTSSATDVFPSTNTFTFYGSSYTSKYIDFQPVESYDGSNPPQALQALNSDQQKWFSTYDAPPYVDSSGAGGIPFLDFGNQYITISAGYSPSVINGLTWQQIATDLANPSTDVAKNIIGNANYITAAICELTNNQPSAVCQVPAITQIEKTLQALSKGK